MSYIYAGDVPRMPTVAQAAAKRGPIMPADYKGKGEYNYDRPANRPQLIITLLVLIGALAGLASCS